MDKPHSPLETAMTDSVDLTDSELEQRIKRDYTYDLDAHDQFVSEFDAYEAMLMSKTYDSVSKKTKGGITDGATTTIYLERAARVVGQLPTGETKAAGKKDAGKGALMDIIRQKYIYPNANAQWPLLNKVRMWDFYSSVYGYMPMFVDWHVSPTGYIGPDCWLWNPRNFVPQNGRYSISDMDYCHAISYVGVGFLKDLLDEDDDAGWDKDKLKELIQAAADSTLWNDNVRDTFVKRTRQNQSVKNEIPLVTRYENGKDGAWVTFCPLLGYKILRNIKNPHKTSRIPFFIKPCIPMFDSFYGLSDFQRSKPIQFASDGLTNFYFEGLKMNIYPPTIINANGVIKHTVDMRAGAVWQETQPNSIRRLETSTAGLSTYQAAVTQMKGALLNLAGTTDTTVGQTNGADPSLGKTPEALKKLSQRESTRDNQDRFYLEQAFEEVQNYMNDLIVNIGTETIPIDLWSEEVKDIVEAGYTDVIEMLKISESGSSAQITINPKALKGCTYRFKLSAGTTAVEDKSEQKESLMDFLGIISKMQNELSELRNQGIEIDWKYVFEAYGELAGIATMDKIFKPITPQEQQQEQQAMQGETQATAPVPMPHVNVRLNGDLTQGQEMNVANQQGFAQPGEQPQDPNGLATTRPNPIQQPNGGSVMPAHPGAVPPPAQAMPQQPQQPQSPLTPPTPGFHDPEIAARSAALANLARR